MDVAVQQDRVAKLPLVAYTGGPVELGIPLFRRHRAETIEDDVRSARVLVEDLFRGPRVAGGDRPRNGGVHAGMGGRPPCRDARLFHPCEPGRTGGDVR
jgi:hypothetical protein